MKIPKTTPGWIRYYESNAENLLRVDWQFVQPLSAEECRIVAPSLRVFQLGESSEGKSLMSVTGKFAKRHGSAHLEEAMSKFIAEEGRHAAWLAKFMDQQGISRAERHWTDRVFRILRQSINLEIALTVLLTAELVARVYYHALYLATSSRILRQICRQLLRDEVFHVYFHTQMLQEIQKGRVEILKTLYRFAYRFFHGTTLLVVWAGHRKVLKKAGFSFTRYWKTSRKYCEHAMELLAGPILTGKETEGRSLCGIIQS